MPGNIPPIVDPGNDQAVYPGRKVTLDGSASVDPDGSIASYVWTQISGPMVFIAYPALAVTTFISPNVLVDTELVFRLLAVDNDGNSTTADVTIKVFAPELDDRFPTVDLPSRAGLLLPQYEESTRMQTLVREIIAILDEEVAAPLLRMERAMNPDVSEGVILDWLGARLGFPRPSVRTAGSTYFGFEGVTAARGWSQAPFFSQQADLEDVEPVGDNQYRRLLRARAMRLRGGSNRRDIEKVAMILFGNGYLLEGGELFGAPLQVSSLKVDPKPQHFGFEGTGAAGWDQEPFLSTAGIRTDANLLTWSAPGSQGGPVSGYFVEVSVDEGPYGPLAANQSGTQYLHSGVTAGSTYRYRVSAINSFGRGPASPPAVITVSGTGGTTPTNMPPVVSIETMAQTVNGGDALQLMATITDPDGTIASMEWSGAGTFADKSAEDTEWTAPTKTLWQQVFTLTLTAVDNDGAVTSASVNITVRGAAVGSENLQLVVTTKDDLLYTTVDGNLEALVPRPAGKGMTLVRL